MDIPQGLKMEVLAKFVRNLAVEIQRTTEGGVSFKRLDVLTTMAERVLRACDYCSSHTKLYYCCADCLNRVASSLDDSALEPYGYHIPVAFSGARGRPKIVISEGILNYFFSHGFTATSTSMLLQVSLSTIRRRMREYGMRVQDRYSDISDQELDRIVTSIQHRNPNCGYRMMQG